MFDYQHMAANADYLIEVETKGSCIKQASTGHPESIRQHKKNISEKKIKIAERENKSGKKMGPCLRYGTIAAIHHEHGTGPKCILVDPPDDIGPIRPGVFRLLSRLHFLKDWISFISPRSQLTHALVMRIVDLEALADPFELNGVPLRKATGEAFSFGQFNPFTGKHSSFFANKSRVIDGPAGGVVLQISDRQCFFYGIREDLVELASKQAFEQLLSYKEDAAASVVKTVECRFTKDTFEDLILPEEISRSAEQSGNYVWFKLSGQLHYSQEGLVFGILPLPGIMP